MNGRPRSWLAKEKGLFLQRRDNTTPDMEKAKEKKKRCLQNASGAAFKRRRNRSMLIGCSGRERGARIHPSQLIVRGEKRMVQGREGRNSGVGTWSCITLTLPKEGARQNSRRLGEWKKRPRKKGGQVRKGNKKLRERETHSPLCRSIGVPIGVWSQEGNFTLKVSGRTRWAEQGKNDRQHLRSHQEKKGWRRIFKASEKKSACFFGKGQRGKSPLSPGSKEDR